MIGHRVECGARAAAVVGLWGYVLWPGATLSWLSLGCHPADSALEGKRVDKGEGNVPEEQANGERAFEEPREDPASDAAESSDNQYHGFGWLRCGLGSGEMPPLTSNRIYTVLPLSCL